MEAPNIEGIPLNPTFMRVVFALLIVLLIFAISTVLTFALNQLSDRFPARRFFFKRLQPIPQIGSYAVAAIVVLQLLGPQKEVLWGILMSAGLAIALAAQDLVKDVIGGIVVLFDSSFQVGDRIKVDDFYGEVTKVGLRSTKMTTPDDSLVTIPNSHLLLAGVSNTNAGAVDCLVTTHLYLPPNVDLVTIERIVRESVLTSKAVYLEKPIEILMKEELIETRLNHVEIRAYVFDTRYEEMFATDLTRRIKKAFYDSDLIPEDLGPDGDLLKEIKSDHLNGRIRAVVADNLMDLSKRFSRSAASSTNGY